MVFLASHCSGGPAGKHARVHSAPLCHETAKPSFSLLSPHCPPRLVSSLPQPLPHRLERLQRKGDGRRIGKAAVEPGQWPEHKIQSLKVLSLTTCVLKYKLPARSLIYQMEGKPTSLGHDEVPHLVLGTHCYNSPISLVAR